MPGNQGILRILMQDNALYPSVLLSRLVGDAPPRLFTLGNRDLLVQRKTALFCSARCPGGAILAAYDQAALWRDKGCCVISGFHSPIEKECLDLLLRGKQPIVICPARSMVDLRIPVNWRKPLANGRLLLLSPFEERHRRLISEMAEKRNRFVAALADTIFIAYAAHGSKTEALCREALSWKKPAYTFECDSNRFLIEIGVQPVTNDSLQEWAGILSGNSEKPR